MNNRQAGRRRGRGGQQQRPQGNGGRQDNGNRIDSRARGNAAQLLEKYKNMARDAQMQGDRVNTEYYLQFADHYFRVLSDSRSRFEEQNPNQQRARRDDGANSFDQDDGDFEEEPIAAEQPRRQLEYQRDDHLRGSEQREDRSRDDRPREDRPREDRSRDDRPRGNVQRDGNGQRDGNRYRDNYGEMNGGGDVPAAIPTEMAEPVRREPAPTFANPTFANDEDVAPEPRRRGRPRRERPAADVAAQPEVIDADRLPPSLGIAPPADVEGDAPPPRPRRRARAATEGPASVS